MRKSFLKSVVAVAVVGATMAITSVAAMAATYEFKLGESDAATAGNVAKTYSNFFTTCDGSSKAAVDKNSMPSADMPYDFFGIDETESYTYRYKTGATLADKGSGVINGGIKFTVDEDADITIVYRSGSNGNVRSIGVYPYENDALSNTAAFSFSNNGNGEVSATNVYKKSGSLEAGTYVIGGYDGAINIYYIKVETKEETPSITEGTFSAQGGDVVVKGTDAYLVGKVTSLDADSVTLSVGANKSFTSDTVYKSVATDDGTVIAEEAEGTYYFAVKVTDLTSDDDVARLQNFTIA